MAAIEIRLWDGNKALGIISVDQSGGSSWVSLVGGANNSACPDIELDPFVGLIVDHSVEYPSPVNYRSDTEADPLGDGGEY